MGYMQDIDTVPSADLIQIVNTELARRQAAVDSGKCPYCGWKKGDTRYLDGVWQDRKHTCRFADGGFHTVNPPYSMYHVCDVVGIKYKASFALYVDGRVFSKADAEALASHIEVREKQSENSAPPFRSNYQRVVTYNGKDIYVAKVDWSPLMAEEIYNKLYSTPKPMSLTFDALRKANTVRLPLFKNSKGEPAHSKPDGSDWDLSTWCNAVLGELGEAANIIKKIRRGDITLDEARPSLGKEFADVNTYLDILAMQCGVDLGRAVRDKFNEVSARVGCDVKL